MIGKQKSQRGVALLEVLIAFFVLSIGLLGLAGLQLKTMQFNQSSMQRSQAMFTAYDMLDRIRLDREGMQLKEFDTGGWVGSAAGKNAELDGWIEIVSSSFPQGEGQVACDRNNVCSVSVRWTDRFTPAGQDGVINYEEISLESEM